MRVALTISAGLLPLLTLSQAIQVYLVPSPSLPSSLSLKHATFALSRHLGLDFFETVGGDAELLGDEEFFVGQGLGNALLLTMDERDARDIIPEYMQATFSLADEEPVTSLTSVVSTYLHRAPHVYTRIFTTLSLPQGTVPRILDLFSLSSSPATELFLSEMSALTSFLDDPHPSKFAALELQGLPTLAQTYGRASEQYTLAAQTIRALLESALAAQRESASLSLALLTFSPPPPSPSSSSAWEEQEASPQLPRQEAPPQSPLPVPPVPPQQPIGGISTCFATAEACTNATDTCSGRGECVRASKAGRTCFLCSCRKTVVGGGAKKKTQIWVGERCERKDISGPFVLITGTTIVLLLLVAGSISLLHTVGKQELPSTLLAGATGGLRKD